MKGELQPLLGTGEDGVLFAIRQKDKRQYLLLQRVTTGRMVEEACLAHLDAVRLEVAVEKAIEALAPVTIWGLEP